MCSWEPITTAPRDGSWILLRGVTGYINRPYRVCVGKWYPDYHAHSPWQESEGRDFTEYGDDDQPTHWMPLPKEEP